MKQKILVLDDDPDILDIISYILTDKGYEVVSLDSGEQIFSAIQQFHPDLVLMDVMLGSMDGRVICNQLKQQSETNAIPVVLISASMTWRKHSTRKAHLMTLSPSLLISIT